MHEERGKPQWRIPVAMPGPGGGTSGSDSGRVESGGEAEKPPPWGGARRALGGVRARWGALVRRRRGELHDHWRVGVAALHTAAVELPGNLHMRPPVHNMQPHWPLAPALASLSLAPAHVLREGPMLAAAAVDAAGKAVSGVLPKKDAKDAEYAHGGDSSSIKFENVRSKKLTRVTIETHDKHDLLLELCSALSSLGLSVASAQCTTAEGGTVAAGFEVRNEKGSMVPPEEWNLVRTRLLASCRKRGGKDWRHKDRRLKEIFNAIGHNQPGFLSSGKVDQDMVNQYARTLRLPTAFVADFVQEADTLEDDALSFEEFAASVRAKEAMLYSVYDEIDSQQRGRIGRRHLEWGLRRVELRTGRYGVRKKISRSGVVKMMKLLGGRRHIDREEFRDLLIMLPAKDLVTVSPYYMKVGVDVTGRNIMPPDRRKDGPPWGHFVAGGTAGIVSKTLSSPLNVIAIRIATAAVDAPLAGALSVIPRAAAQVWAKDGLGGFWRGNFTNTLSSAPGKAIDFFSYALFKSLLTKGEREPNDAERFVAGALAGMTSDGLLYPLEVISTRMAISGQYNSAAHAVAHIWKTEGLRGFYAGLGSALFGVVPYAGCSFAAYDILSSRYRKWAGVESAGVMATFGCGLASGWFASTISYPLYNVTLRLQAQGGAAAGAMAYTGMQDAMRHILLTQGLRGFYRGYLPATLKMIPMSGASFATYEMVKQKLGGATQQDTDSDDEDDQDDKDTLHNNQPTRPGPPKEG